MHPVFEAFFKDKLAPLTLRLALAFVCLYHGFSKIMLTGGLNWNPSLPVGWQFLIAWGEFGCGAAILLGFWCRSAAAVVVGLIIGNIAWQYGARVFSLPLRSLEPTVLLLLVGLALLFLGAGELSLDARAGGSGSSGGGKSPRKKAAA